MLLHGIFRDVEFAGDLAICLTACKTAKHLELSVGKPIPSVDANFDIHIVGSDLGSSLERNRRHVSATLLHELNCRNHERNRQSLRNVSSRPCGKRGADRLAIVNRRNRNQRDVWSGLAKFEYRINPRTAREAQVEKRKPESLFSVHALKGTFECGFNENLGTRNSSLDYRRHKFQYDRMVVNEQHAHCDFPYSLKLTPLLDSCCSSPNRKTGFLYV